MHRQSAAQKRQIKAIKRKQCKKVQVTFLWSNSLFILSIRSYYSGTHYRRAAENNKDSR